jgi:hypothetical protein
MRYLFGGVLDLYPGPGGPTEPHPPEDPDSLGDWDDDE